MLGPVKRRKAWKFDIDTYRSRLGGDWKKSHPVYEYMYVLDRLKLKERIANYFEEPGRTIKLIDVYKLVLALNDLLNQYEFRRTRIRGIHSLVMINKSTNGTKRRKSTSNATAENENSIAPDTLDISSLSLSENSSRVTASVPESANGTIKNTIASNTITKNGNSNGLNVSSLPTPENAPKKPQGSDTLRELALKCKHYPMRIDELLSNFASTNKTANFTLVTLKNVVKLAERMTQKPGMAKKSEIGSGNQKLGLFDKSSLKVEVGVEEEILSVNFPSLPRMRQTTLTWAQKNALKNVLHTILESDLDFERLVRILIAIDAQYFAFDILFPRKKRREKGHYGLYFAVPVIRTNP